MIPVLCVVVQATILSHVELAKFLFAVTALKKIGPIFFVLLSACLGSTYRLEICFTSNIFQVYLAKG
ncbi:hypothetical protein CMI37_00450 [Candidatus Pacearchaeota archaeon]|nr:hypothetical protein [Candidatus Pacearchaeota archaeon]